MAQRTNKRTRNATTTSSNERAAFGGSTASGGDSPQTSITYSGKAIPALRGTKLEPLIESAFIASQPKEFILIISEQSSEMLDLMFLIKQREASCSKFESGTEDKPFIPTFLRKKNPIHGSGLLKDNEKIKEVVARAETENEAHAANMAELAAELAKVELTCREELLHSKIMETLQLIAEGILITVNIKMPSAYEKMEIKESKLATHAVLSYLNTYSELFMKTHWRIKTSKLEFVERFRDHVGSESLLELTEQLTEDEKSCSSFISLKLSEVIPQVTHKLWDWHAKNERERKADAELKSYFEKRKQDKMNQDVEMNLEAEPTIPPKALENLIATNIKKVLQSEKAKANQALRKNYSGGAKNQALQPTKNGPRAPKSSRNTSTKSRGRARSQSKERLRADSINSDEEEKSKAPSVLKKKVRWPQNPNNSKPRSRSRPRGGRGDQRSGGRGRGRGKH
jgi:hypothetical protein